MKQRKHQVTTYLSVDLKDKVKALADEWKCSHSQVIERLISNSKELKTKKA